MSVQEKKNLERYKWTLHHPLYWQILMYLLLAVYFLLWILFEAEIRHTVYGTVLHICIFVPIGVLIAVQMFLEHRGTKTLKNLFKQEISVREILQIYEELYAGIDFSKRRHADTYLDYVLSVAPLYMLIGEVDRAIELYQSLLSKKYKRAVPKGVRPILYGDLADCFAEKGDICAAQSTMQAAAEAVRRQIRRNPKKQAIIEENLNACTRAKLELKCGNPALMAKILAEMPAPKTQQVPLEQAALERLRGWTAYVQGDYAEAQRAYAYVYEHGKDTFYTQEAKYYLDKIREQNAN